MTAQELQIALTQMGVTVEDLNRAALYYDYLTFTRSYFFDELRKPEDEEGLGDAYDFCSAAIRKPDLLKQLGKVLDLRISPAIDADMNYAFRNGHNNWVYDDYFNNMIFNANELTFIENVASFRERYPISGFAGWQITENFKHNIRTCCLRVYDDLDRLKALYDDLYNNSLQFQRLTNIHSSGSDFHKGGTQVLILTFAIRYNNTEGQAVNSELKVVYKPSDLEADCLLAGNSTAVNRVIDQFMAQSLFEIYNRIIKDYYDSAMKLPTYRILPRNYNSAHGANLPLPIREAYGYLEYLNNNLDWGDSEFWGYYKNAASDYLIFKSEVASNIIYRFYLRAGAYAAIASTFSNLDLHIENIRVVDRVPYLIDMEISLATHVDDVGLTSLFGTKGGITGEYVAEQDYVWEVRDRNRAGRSYLHRKYKRKTYANRLYKALPKKQKELVPVNHEDLLDGFNTAMAVLKIGQEHNMFDNWFMRLNNVVVRYLPYATPDFRYILNEVIITRQINGRGRNVTYEDALTAALLERRTYFFNQYQDGALPHFLAFLDVQSGPDYMNLDIPVYYHRIGNNSRDIVNSRGQLVTIPVQIQIEVDDQPQMVPCGVRVQRNTYFPNDPTATAVRASQVTILSDQQQYRTRFNLLLQSLLDSLGLREVPRDIRFLIGPDLADSTQEPKHSKR